VEVKIGVQHSPRELVFETRQSPDEIEAAVSKALESETILSLVDERGRRIVVPAGRIAYVEIGPQTERRIGFVATS
jgi:peptidyl-tRNA hydrolase